MRFYPEGETVGRRREYLNPCVMMPTARTTKAPTAQANIPRWGCDADSQDDESPDSPANYLSLGS